MSTNSLILIAEVDCAGVSTATLTGVDTTYDVYICKWNNTKCIHEFKYNVEWISWFICPYSSISNRWNKIHS